MQFHEGLVGLVAFFFVEGNFYVINKEKGAARNQRRYVGIYIEHIPEKQMGGDWRCCFPLQVEWVSPLSVY